MSATVTSQKRPLLLVDHVFHRKTKSFDFLREVLERQFEVRHIYIVPDAPIEDALVSGDYEHVVLAQMDLLTPLFISAGKRVCVVQMYDGSSALPDAHWRLNRQARYLNFCADLHLRALRAGSESMLVRYYPDPKRFSPVTDYSTARGFFWQRLPNSDINLAFIQQLLGNSLDSLHVHTPPDDKSAFDPAPLKQFNCRISRSDWFETQWELLAVLESCNIFVAPRYAEGIGHAYLEAMARGMVVLAYNLPTHSEYICNWRNGILFDLNSRNLELSSDQLKRLGAAARASVEIGFERWCADHDAINKFVAETPRSVPPTIDVGALVNEVIASYQHGLVAYAATLNKNDALVNVFGSWRDLQNRTLVSRTTQQQVHRSDRITIFAGAALGKTEFIGWSVPEGSHRWALRRGASIAIPLEEDITLKSLTLDMAALKPMSLHIGINGREVGEIKLTRTYERRLLNLEAPVQIGAGSLLRLRFKAANILPIPKVESRALKFALKAVQFDIA